jgi:hypothetical protein
MAMNKRLIGKFDQFGVRIRKERKKTQRELDDPLYNKKRLLNSRVKYDIKYTLNNIILAKVAVDDEGIWWINISNTKRVISEWKRKGNRLEFTVWFKSLEHVKLTPAAKKGIPGEIVSNTTQEMNAMLEILRQSELEHKLRQTMKEHPDD